MCRVEAYHAQVHIESPAQGGRAPPLSVSRSPKRLFGPQPKPGDGSCGAPILFLPCVKSRWVWKLIFAVLRSMSPKRDVLYNGRSLIIRLRAAGVDTWEAEERVAMGWSMDRQGISMNGLE